MDMMSNSPNRKLEQAQQALVLLGTNLSRESFHNKDIRTSAFQEGMEIVRKMQGIRIMSEHEFTCTACVFGASSVIAALKMELEKFGHTLEIDDLNEPLLEGAG